MSPCPSRPLAWCGRAAPATGTPPSRGRRPGRAAPEAAVAVVAAAVNSLEALVVFGIARALGLSPAGALGASAAVPLLPLFLARLSLAYFPALVGHALDALVILYLLTRFDRPMRPRVVLAVGGLIAAAALAYTQSLLNFAVLLGTFLLLDVASARDAAARRRQGALAAGAALGAVLSLALFYGRYVAVFLDMRP